MGLRDPLCCAFLALDTWMGPLPARAKVHGSLQQDLGVQPHAATCSGWTSSTHLSQVSVST